MSINLYRVFCITEQLYKTVWGTSPPIVCPTNPLDTIDTGSITIIDKIVENIITVHPFLSSANFHTIKEAVDFSNSLLPALSSISVNPGIYYENNPIIVNNGISVIGSQGPLGCTVIATNSSQSLFQIGNGSIIQDMTMVGGRIAVEYDGSTGSKAGSILRGGIIIDSSIGVQSCIGPGELFVVEILVRNGLGTVNTGFECIIGGKMRCFTSGAFGLPGSNVKNGIRCNGSGSLLIYFSGGFQLCDKAVIVDNKGRVELKSSFIRGSGTALEVGSSLDNKLLISDATILDTINYDLDIKSTSADVQIYGGTLRTDLINNPNNIKIFSNTFSSEPNNEANQILGELHVGSQYQSTETSLGQGDFYVNGMTILTDDGSGTNFINITNDVKNQLITSNFLQGLSSGNVIYIGSDVPFYGFDIGIISNWSSGDSDKIIKEYWNSSWSSFEIMVNNSSLPFSSRTDLILETIETQRIRFGKMINFSSSSINSILKYWIRFRVNSILSGPIPTFNTIKLHPSSLKINNFGFIEYLGQSRPIKILSLNFTPTIVLGNQDIYLSDNLDIGKSNNIYLSSTISRSGTNFILPKEIDTSYGFKIRWYYISTSTGNSIDWVIRWGWSDFNSIIYTDTFSAPSIGVNEQSLSFSTIVSASIGQQIDEFKILNIPKLNARPSSGSGDMLWITLERTNTDTHTGDLIILNIQSEYIAFCEGGSIIEF